MIIRSTTKKIKRIREWHQKKGIPYVVKTTNTRIEFKSSYNHVMNRDSAFPAKELNFIKQVKQTVIKEGIHNKIKNRFKQKEDLKKISYFRYNPSLTLGSKFENVFEIDLESAYWETAHKLGILTDDLYRAAVPKTWDEALSTNLITKRQYRRLVLKNRVIKPKMALDKGIIDEWTYEQMLSKSKRSRLAAIGTLAKTTRIFIFDGVKETEMEPVGSPETEFLWHTICWEVGKIMEEAVRAIEKNDFIFYWVDAMFVKEGAVKKVEQVFKKHGYNYGRNKCVRIEFTEDRIEVEGKGRWVRIDGKKVWETVRPFPYKKSAKSTKAKP